MAYLACEKLMNVIRWRSMLTDNKKTWKRETDKKRIETELKKLEKKLVELKKEAKKYRGKKNYPFLEFDKL